MTPIAAEGLPPVDTVEADATGLARLILALHNDPLRNAAAARAGRAALRRHFSQKRVDHALATAIGACGGASSCRERIDTTDALNVGFVAEISGRRSGEWIETPKGRDWLASGPTT
jgi:hypothetical protein